MANPSISSLAFSWVLNGLYFLFLITISPFLIYRRITLGKYRRGWREKLTGKLTRQHPDQTCLWFHAVSVGEVLQLQKLLDEAESRFPEAEFFITVTTETGYDVAKAKYPKFTVAYFPLDFSWAVETALSEIRPNLIALVELELWPNFVFAARRRKIPLVLVNGRMGAKSFRGYSRIRFLMRWLLGCFDILAVQNSTYAERLISLGAPNDRVIVTGNIKFDRVESDRSNAKTVEIRRGFGIADGSLTLVAGSTQDPEEAFAIDAWLALRSDYPNLNLILVPRHKERFEEVSTLITQRGCHAIRRSEILKSSITSSTTDISSEAARIGLLDTLGELAACWGVADIAFVGGSLTNRGGQNMIEPAGYGAAVLFGPNTWNFKDIVESLLSQNAARVIRDRDELREAIRDLLIHPVERQRLGDVARSFVTTQQGATRRTVDLIVEVLARSSQIPQPAGEPNSSGRSRSTQIWLIAKLLLFVVVLVFIGVRAYKIWVTSPQTTIQLDFRWLCLAGLCYFVGWIPSVWLWRSFLISLNQPLSWWDTFRAYYVGHVGKYVPGKALVLVIRGSLTKNAGINPIAAGLTAAFETLVFMAVGVAWAAAVAPWAISESHSGIFAMTPVWRSSAPIVVPILAAFATFLSTPISAWLFTRVSRKALGNHSLMSGHEPGISATLISAGVIATSLGWICHAASLVCVIRSISSEQSNLAQLPIDLFAITVSTVGGFVVLFAPGGLGVREGLLAEILKDEPTVGPATAIVTAGLLRAVWFATELIVAGIFFICGGRTIPQQNETT